MIFHNFSKQKLKIIIYKTKETDDIDDLKNKRIRTAGELIKNQINLSCIELVKNIKERLDYIEEILKKNLTKSNNTNYKQTNIRDIINPNIITNSIKNYFASNQLSQIMEETNPLAEITQKRKISSFGVGAVDRKRANLNVREIHPSQYGRICPIETTEGKNAGLILSLSKDVKIDRNGFIQTPLFM